MPAHGGYRSLVGRGRASLQLPSARRQAAGILAVATAVEGPVGYAFVVLHQGPDDTFDYEGDRYAELFTLSVAPRARGQGVGGRLCDLVEAELAERGVTELEVAVMAGNDEALRFYRRRGFRPSEELLRRPIAAKR